MRARPGEFRLAIRAVPSNAPWAQPAGTTAAHRFLRTGGTGAEHWQILSRVRSRTGGVGGLNWLIRRTWRADDTARARRTHALPNPIGADEILYHDKVMCAVNQPRKAKNLGTAACCSGARSGSSSRESRRLGGDAVSLRNDMK